MRQRYYPAYGDEKTRQGVRSASLLWFGTDLTDEILNETWHRHQRTSSPTSPPQPWTIAHLKVFLRLAAEHENQELVKHLEAVDKARLR